MFSQMRLGMNQLCFYEPVNSGIDYLSSSGDNRVTGLHVWVMLKEPIQKNNPIYAVLVENGWSSNSQGTVWSFYK